MTARGIVLAVALLVSAGGPQAQESSVIDFPTSGSPSAQALFIAGVTALHSLDYEAARDAFVAAQDAQPGFAMAYWGEAMTYTRPLTEGTASDRVRTALGKLAPTSTARLAKAPTEREKEWLGAAEKLAAASDSPGSARTGRVPPEQAYADAMKRVAERHPNDIEARVFYALALLGTMENGRDAAIARRAAALLDGVLATHPQHPGALLYAIYAADDTGRSEAALKYADAYVQVAPSAAPALHLASRPYAARGMWDRVSTLNERAARSRGPQRLEALQWLVYSNVQQGQYVQARRVLEELEAAVRDTNTPDARAQLARARAAWLIETRKWADVKTPVDPTEVPRDASAAELFAVGIAGLRSGNRAAAATAMQRLAALMEEAPVNLAPVRSSPAPSSGSRPGITPVAPGPKAVLPPGVTPISPSAPQGSRAPQSPEAPLAPMSGIDRRVPQVMAQQLEAMMLFSEGRREEAVVLARQAAVVESLMSVQAGPAAPVKPVNEQVGEMLMDLRRPKEAMEAFGLSLTRHPGRALSLLGLARSSAQSRDLESAQRAYSQLRELWKNADPALPELKEIATALGPKPSSR